MPLWYSLRDRSAMLPARGFFIWIRVDKEDRRRRSERARSVGDAGERPRLIGADYRRSWGAGGQPRDKPSRSLLHSSEGAGGLRHRREGKPTTVTPSCEFLRNRPAALRDSTCCSAARRLRYQATLPKRSLRFHLDQPQDDIAVQLAGATHGRETVDDGRLEPDQALALGAFVSEGRGLFSSADKQRHQHAASCHGQGLTMPG